MSETNNSTPIFTEDVIRQAINLGFELGVCKPKKAKKKTKHKGYFDVLTSAKCFSKLAELCIAMDNSYKSERDHDELVKRMSDAYNCLTVLALVYDVEPKELQRVCSERIKAKLWRKGFTYLPAQPDMFDAVEETVVTESEVTVPAKELTMFEQLGMM